MSSLSRTYARESKRGSKLMEQHQEGKAKEKGPTGEKKLVPVKVLNAHRRCSKCHYRPTKKEVKQKLFLYKGFSLCEMCYSKVGA
jgi:hypothetical protein